MSSVSDFGGTLACELQGSSASKVATSSNGVATYRRNNSIVATKRVHNSVLRLALGTFKSTPIVSLHAKSGLKTLERYRKVKIVNYLLQIKANANRMLLEK